MKAAATEQVTQGKLQPPPEAMPVRWREIAEMPPLARAAFISLLAAAWQSPKGELQNAAWLLAEAAGLTVHEWQMCAPLVVAKFESDSRHLRFTRWPEWTEARRVSPRCAAEEFLRSWNELRGPLPPVEYLTEDRRRRIERRVAQGVLTLEQWRRAVWISAHTPFLLNRGPGARGFRVTFNWLLDRDDKRQNVLDGAYGTPVLDEQEQAQKTARERAADERRRDRIMADFARRVAEGKQYAPSLMQSIAQWKQEQAQRCQNSTTVVS